MKIHAGLEIGNHERLSGVTWIPVYRVKNEIRALLAVLPKPHTWLSVSVGHVDLRGILCKKHLNKELLLTLLSVECNYNSLL